MAEARETRVRPMTPDEVRMAEAQAQADVMAEVLERRATETEPGGRYKIGEQWVDAEGQPIKAKKGGD